MNITYLIYKATELYDYGHKFMLTWMIIFLLAVIIIPLIRRD